MSQKNFIKKIKSEINLNNFDQQFKKLKDLKVLVLGETIIDKYVFCEALGKSGKEPHLVLRDLKEEVYLGGVIAIARSISDFCKNVKILSMLGQDKRYEKYIRKNLAKNIKSQFLYKYKSPTIVKKRYIDHVNKNKILGVYSMNDELLNKKDKFIFEKMVLKEIKKYDLIVISDYGHGLITKKLAKLLCKNSKYLALNAQTNASNIGYHTIQKYKGVDCVVMNETELRHELRDKNEKKEILAKIPLVNYIYNTIKQITDTLTVSQKHAFKKVVYIEYPKENIWTIALVTGESKDSQNNEYYQIFVPTTPNPTSGFMLYVKKKDTKETDMSIDEGLKIIISGGMLAPGKNEI